VGVLLDTRSVPPAQRLDYWSKGIAQHFFPIDFGAASETFNARLTGGQVGPITVRSLRAMPHRVLRTRDDVKQADPDSILLYMMREGTCDLEQDGHSCVIGPGDFGWHDSSRPSAFTAITSFEMLVLSLPKGFLGPALKVFDPEEPGRLTGGTASFARLASPFISGLAYAADSEGLSASEGQVAAEMLLTMLKAYEEPGGTESFHSRELLTQIQHYILLNLDNEELGPVQIARAHFVSTRYVHKLFSASGTSAAAWIRARRLERARRELETAATESVAAVAVRAGYRDAASFSRAFRSAFGVSPREVRPRA
jgi:AraC-like DNA-binding protein